MSTVEIGRQTENLVSEFILNRKMVILERNFRTRSGEIDIIALDDSCIAFIEVKKLPQNWDESDISLKVDDKKRLKIKKTAIEYMSNRKEIRYYSPRFDVVSVHGRDIIYYKGAF